MNPHRSAADAAPANPHVPWRQALGLVFWAGLAAIPAILAGQPLVGLLVLALAGVTVADAWVSGIYKHPSRKAFFNVSPMAWGIGMAWLFVVTYPLYLFKRNKLRTVDAGNAYFAAVVVLGLALIALTAASLAAVVGGTSTGAK